MKKTKDQDGITLIGLVVTIVVLMILATISIFTVFGQNGIISKAKETKERMIIADAKETIRLIVLEYELSGKEDSLENFLKEKVPKRIDSVINNGDGTLKVSKNGYSEDVEETYVGNKKNYVVNVKVTANSYLTNYPSAPISFLIVGERNGKKVYNDIVCFEIDKAGSYEKSISLKEEEGTNVTVKALYTGNNKVNNNVSQTIKLNKTEQTVEYSMDYNGGLLSTAYLEVEKYIE